MTSYRELVRRRSVRRGVIVFVAATAALGSGVAYAAWTSSGTGNATATAATAQAPVVSGGAVTTGLLYPGATGNAAVSVKNPNAYPVKVTSVALVPGSALECALGFVTSAPMTQIASGATATVELTGAVTMGNADNSCQGKTFSIPVTVTIASA
ncbi:hypothetical protein V1227_37965 [Lentzea sp. DG1S-22]|uniref:hypothetical protein n=1 Tax=Lentzea sp. DG1S-22 TaxID=3108822 RepID=UPI002E7643A3|nr:hypothetical protein [Lentzea sp. DG1S-22]WVH80709.1 hypothetical protein V1227_37965 [Lentzea sp. DG1S-22]